MKKTKSTGQGLAVMLLLLVCITAFAGCKKAVNDVMNIFSGDKNDETEEGWDAVKLNKDIIYYNDYLGISYIIPKGWWLYAVNEDNFGESKGDIGDAVSMDLINDNYENYIFSSAWLAAFGNLEKSSQDNHLGFDLDVRALDGINDMAGFMKYFEEFMLEPEEEEEYKLTDSQKITIKGKAFELRDYLVTQADNPDFYIMTLSCQVKNGYFFNIKVDYWADNTRAKNAIIESVTKAVDFY